MLLLDCHTWQHTMRLIICGLRCQVYPKLYITGAYMADCRSPVELYITVLYKCSEPEVLRLLIHLTDEVVLIQCNCVAGGSLYDATWWKYLVRVWEAGVWSGLDLEFWVRARSLRVCCSLTGPQPGLSPAAGHSPADLNGCAHSYEVSGFNQGCPIT